MIRIFSLVSLVFLLLATEVASANPRALPFSYPYATLAEGAIELELFVDMIPVRVLDSSGSLMMAPRSELTLEVEYGLLDNLELGLYFVAKDDPGAGTGDAGLSFDGIKQRLRWRLGEADEWPVNLSLYLELAEKPDEFEIEAKINLEKRFGDLSILVNLWAEREFEYSGEGLFILNPTAGVTYAFSPHFHLGLEYWMHAIVGAPATTDVVTKFNEDPHHFLGPAVMLNFGKLWWSVAPYLRLDGLSGSPTLGQAYGPLYIRTVLGIEL